MLKLGIVLAILALNIGAFVLGFLLRRRRRARRVEALLEERRRLRG